MQFLYRFPVGTISADPSLLAADSLSGLAVAAEQSGFSGVAFDEHPIPPEYWRQAGDGHDSLDPFLALAAVAAATTKVRLFTYATILPIRNPFLLAKTVATLDVLSKGRVELGVAAGYLPQEFQALGVDFEDRNKMFDESIEAMKLAWTGEPISFKGAHFEAIEVTAQPRPVQQPHPPLWIAGNSRLSLRRVVASGRGWLALPNPRVRTISRRSAPLESLDDLQALLTTMQLYAREMGRKDPIEVMYPVGRGPGRGRNEVRAHLDELEQLGVTWISLSSSAATITEAHESVARLADEFIVS